MQIKHITLCMIAVHIKIKGNENADKAAYETMGVPGRITTKRLYTERNS